MAKKEKNPPVEEEAKSGGAIGEQPAPSKKGGKMKLIIVVVLALVVGLGGGVAAMKFMGGGSQPETTAESPAPGTDSEAPVEKSKQAAEHGAAPEEGLEAIEPAGPQNIEFKPFVVNLNDAGGKRFLKLTMSVEAETQALADEINAKTPQFRDIILLLLSSLSYDDIATLDGKMRLRNQMLNRINTQLSSGKVKNIYFSEFVVQ